MNKERLIIDENKLSYEEILRIKEHAKKYDEVADKKEFLRNEKSISKFKNQPWILCKWIISGLKAFILSIRIRVEIRE